MQGCHHENQFQMILQRFSESGMHHNLTHNLTPGLQNSPCYANQAHGEETVVGIHCFAGIRLPIADILLRLFSLYNGHEGSFVA